MVVDVKEGDVGVVLKVEKMELEWEMELYEVLEREE